MATFPEMKILNVELLHWLTFLQLVHLYSVGQMAPGPNMMMTVSIGEWAAGILGAIVAVIAFFGPTSLLTLLVGRLVDGPLGDMSYDNGFALATPAEHFRSSEETSPSQLNSAAVSDTPRFTLPATRTSLPSNR
jgi:Chromate transporter